MSHDHRMVASAPGITPILKVGKNRGIHISYFCPFYKKKANASPEVPKKFLLKTQWPKLCHILPTGYNGDFSSLLTRDGQMRKGLGHWPAVSAAPGIASIWYSFVFNIGLNDALETTVNYFNFFHNSFITSQGKHREVEGTGMISDLLLRALKPQQDWLWNLRPPFSPSVFSCWIHCLSDFTYHPFERKCFSPCSHQTQAARVVLLLRGLTPRSPAPSARLRNWRPAIPCGHGHLPTGSVEDGGGARDAGGRHGEHSAAFSQISSCLTVLTSALNTNKSL